MLYVPTVSPSAVSLALGIVGVVVVIVATVVVYVKLKMDIALFLRETLCCYRRSSGGNHVFVFNNFCVASIIFHRMIQYGKSSQAMPSRLMLFLFVVVCLDGKSFDAFLLCYKSVTDTGLNADDRKRLESDLEERFGYSLCLHDRDVPGNGTYL